MTFDRIEPFLEYFESVRGRTLRVVEHIPEDRLDWAPAEGRFTFGDMIRHLGATERYMFAENARGEPSRYPGRSRGAGEFLPAPGAGSPSRRRTNVNELRSDRRDRQQKRAGSHYRSGMTDGTLDHLPTRIQ